jgi:hypothetical protein
VSDLGHSLRVSSKEIIYSKIKYFNALTLHIFIKNYYLRFLTRALGGPLAFPFDQYITPQLM